MSKKIYNKEQKSALLVAMLTSFLTTFMGSALNLSIPNIGSELDASAATASWIISIYMLTCAVLAIPFGILADRIAGKKILCAGLFIFFVGTALSMFCSNIYYFLCLRCGQAFGAAMIFATNIPILISSFGSSNKGNVLGYATAANYSGLFAGPVLGGAINYYIGWKFIFALSAVISIVTLIIAIKKIPTKESKYIRFKKEKNSIKNDIKHIMVNKVFLYGIIAAFASFGAVFGSNYLISIYLQIVKGYTSQWAGIVLIVAPLAQSIFSLVSGKLSDKINACKISAFGILLSGVAILLLIFIDKNSSLLMIVIVMMIMGTGSAFFAAPNTNIVMSSVNENNYSLASSILSTMRSFGHTASIWGITFFTKLEIGNALLNEANPGDLMAVMYMSFYFFVGLCISAFFIALKGKT